jgi:hypothetical protein
MAIRSNVTSVEAIESFRASLIVYIAKARAAVEEVSSDVGRTRTWVQYHQRVFWDEEVKKRKQRLEEAQQILLSSKMSKLRQVSATEQMAVAKAKRALEESEGKLRLIKKWDREIETQTDPLVRQMEKIQGVLGDDMVKAVAYLTQIVETLSAYMQSVAPSVTDLPGQATGKKAGDDAGISEAVSAEAENKGGAS